MSNARIFKSTEQVVVRIPREDMAALRLHLTPGVTTSDLVRAALRAWIARDAPDQFTPTETAAIANAASREDMTRVPMLRAMESNSDEQEIRT